jgi:hypothetical protein
MFYSEQGQQISKMIWDDMGYYVKGKKNIQKIELT